MILAATIFRLFYLQPVAFVRAWASAVKFRLNNFSGIIYTSNRNH